MLVSGRIYHFDTETRIKTSAFCGSTFWECPSTDRMVVESVYPFLDPWDERDIYLRYTYPTYPMAIVEVSGMVMATLETKEWRFVT